MTDPEMADVTYIEPLNLQTMTKIIEKERPDALFAELGWTVRPESLFRAFFDQAFWTNSEYRLLASKLMQLSGAKIELHSKKQ